MAADVHVQRTTLSTDNLVVVQDNGETIYLAYDPRQISEAAALAWLCTRTPRLIGGGLRIVR